MKFLKANVLISVSFLFLLGSTSEAGNQLRVTPIRIEFSKSDKIVVVTVKNEGNTDALIQTAIFDWQQQETNVNGKQELEDRLQPTKDILVSPPIFKLPSQMTQTIRLGLRSVPRKIDADHLVIQEQPYRIKIGEVPTKESQLDTQGLNILVSFSVPIFVKPAGYKTSFNPVWQVVKTGKANKLIYEVFLNNQGNTHEQIKSLKLYADNELIAETTQIGYVLPLKSKSWQLASLKITNAKQFKLVADSDRGLLEENVTVE